MKIKHKLISNMRNLAGPFSGFIKDWVVRGLEWMPESLKQRVLPQKLLLFIHRRKREPGRSQRVYLKNGTGVQEFLKELKNRRIEYVLLRWWENLPFYPAGEDLNILIKDEHRDKINDLVSEQDRRGRKCDIYTLRGAKNGSRFGIPVFPYNLAVNLLNSRTCYKGAYVPAPVPYFASVAYHAILHKGRSSGVPGFEGIPAKLAYDYTAVLHKMASDLNLQVEITVTGLYAWLKENGFAPGTDTLTKLVEKKPELAFLETPLFSDIRGGDLLVFMIRERLVQDGLLKDFTEFLIRRFRLDIIDVHMLDPEEIHRCNTQIRGGKWDKGPYQCSGGTPVAMVVAYDYHPWPLEPSEARKQTRMTNRNNPNSKYEFREMVNSSARVSEKYNGVHSADNEMDAWFYISQLGETYRQQVLAEVELRRDRYASRWSVKKVVAAGADSKVELITYNKDLAVKKTYRPGREEAFEREIFAAGELSNELEFLPPSLETGNGFIIFPYFQNILEGLEPEEKRDYLSPKKREIIDAIDRLEKKGFRHKNLCLDNLILTSNGRFFFTGLSSIQPHRFTENHRDPSAVTVNNGNYPISYESLWESGTK